MKKIYLLLLLAASLGVNSCKKCYDCGETVDGQKVKTCDKARVEAIESGQVYTDMYGNPVYRKCH